jgi:chromosome segregation ATPase
LHKIEEISREKPEGDAHEIALLKGQIMALQDQLEEQQAMAAVEQELETASATGSESLLSNERIWAQLERCSELRRESMRELKATMEAMNAMQYQIGRCTAEKEEVRTRAQRLEEKIHAVEGELAECQQASAYAKFLMQLNLPPVQLQRLQQERDKASTLETQVGRCTAEKDEASTRAQRLEERICAAEGELAECQQVSAYAQLLTKLAYLLRAAAATA